MVARDSRWIARVFGRESYMSCENGKGKWYITDDGMLKLVPSAKTSKDKERLFNIDGKDLIEVETKSIYTLENTNRPDCSD